MELRPVGAIGGVRSPFPRINPGVIDILPRRGNKITASMIHSRGFRSFFLEFRLFALAIFPIIWDTPVTRGIPFHDKIRKLRSVYKKNVWCGLLQEKT